MCRIVTESGAEYIKTSTGFSTGGATFDDVRLFAEHVGEGVKIKAVAASAAGRIWSSFCSWELPVWGPARL